MTTRSAFVDAQPGSTTHNDIETNRNSIRDTLITSYRPAFIVVVAESFCFLLRGYLLLTTAVVLPVR